MIMRAIEWVHDPEEKPLRDDRKLAVTRAAVARQPDSGHLRYHLGIALMQRESWEEAAQSFERALVLDPHDHRSLLALGRARSALHDAPAAVAAFRRCVQASRADVETHFELGRALMYANCEQESVEVLRAALHLQPAHFDSLHLAVRLLLRRNAIDEALGICDVSLERAPGNSAALAIKSQLLFELGDVAAWRFLIDFERFVRVSKLRPPSVFADIDRFNDALAESVRMNPQLQFEPKRRTARHGSRGSLAPVPGTSQAALFDLLAQSVHEYCQSTCSTISHPFTAAAPLRAVLSMWGLVLEPDGHVVPHIHPYGWLSGVYYLHVPAGNDDAGYLELGCADPLFRCRMQPPVHRIAPQPGLLVVFPSYFYHRTIPNRSTEARMSIAFDISAASQRARSMQGAPVHVTDYQPEEVDES